MSRSVRFVIEEEEIPLSSEADENGAGYQPFRPTAEHIITPVPSQLEIQKMEAEAILGSPAFTETTTTVSFVETLLLRLLDDLNSGRLTNEEIMKLASYSMEVLQSREVEAQKERTIMESEEEVEEPYLVASSSSILAKQMVDFTLSKIFNEIKSGKIPEGDMTALIRTVLGDGTGEEEDEISEGDLDEYIDETLKTCVSRVPDRNTNSPVCDALLDDFMVTTLQNLIRDLENEVLTRDQIETLAKTVKDEAKDILTKDSQLLDVQDIQNVLQNILRQLQTGAVELHVLYQIVFAIVYSYNMLRSQPTPEFESKVTDLMKELLFIVEQQTQAENLTDVDLELIHKASEQLSKEGLDVYQIEQLSSTILETVAKPDIVCRTTTSEIARSIVEDALAKAKTKLLVEEDQTLIAGVQIIASAILATHDEEKHVSPSVNDLFIEILGFLRENIRSESEHSLCDFRELEEIVNLINMHEISSSQLEEMAKSVARVISSPLKSESSLMAEINVKDTLKNVRDDLTEGTVETDVLDQMVHNLLTAYRAIKAHAVMAPSMLNSLASFFKTVLGHVTYKVQCGEFNADDISELTDTFKASFEKKTAAPDLKEETTTAMTEIKPGDVLLHLSRVTDKIEKGLLNSRDANRFGKRLVECGNKIFTILSGVSSAVSTPKSEDVAEGLVDEVIKALEEEIDSGLITKESLKEITKTIISTTSETDTRLAEEAVGFTIRGIHRDVERGISPSEMPSVTSVDHTPSASTIADHFVLQTIDYLNSSMKQAMPPDMVVSVATSVASLISEERVENLPVAFQSVKKTIQTIVRSLKSDAINQADAEKIFCLILENYRDFVLTDKRQKSLPDSLPREDHELMNSLIDETLLNIQRSVAAGKLSKKHFSIPSQTSAAGSTTVCGDEIVELTMENLKQYFSTKSIPGSSTIYAHDIVDQTIKDLIAEQKQDTRDEQALKSDGSTTVYAHDLVDMKLDNLAAGIKSDAGSTTIYAYDLVNVTLQNLKSSPEKAVISKPADIVDFILQIVDILTNELSKGAISDLSMAHFFSVISGDTSDLHVLEVNALNNLRQVRQDIAEKRNSSVYVHRILDAYLVPNQTVIEMFSDPLKAVESIMISVSSEILTKFVKATLQTILVEIREGNISLPEKAPSTFVLRSASSIVAENVIQEVVARIKQDIKASIQKTSKGTLGKNEFDRAASTLLSSPQITGKVSKHEKKASDSKHSITSNMSREVEDVILETVHNIVSNLRLEQSMYPQSRTKMTASPMSDEIQEFVLDALQNIITDLQDKKALYELGLARPRDKTTDSVVDGHDTDGAQTMRYVNEVLQSVIQDMKKEKSKYLTEEEKGSKPAANLETMILDCLQNAVTDTVAHATNYGLEPDQEDEVKRIVVESIKQTIKHIKENKLDGEGLKSLRQGLSSVIKTDHQQTSVSPESMVEFLEKEIVRIEDEGLDSETLGRISTQLATLGMEMLSPEECENEDRLSESTVSASATSSLVCTLVQDVLTKLKKELEADAKYANRETDGTGQRTPSKHSSSKGVSNKDVNYNRKISSTSIDTGPSTTNTTLKQDLNYNRKKSTSSNLTQSTRATDISDFSESSEISLPDNSRKAVTTQTIHFKLSQDKNIGKLSQSATGLDSRARNGTRKTTSVTEVKTAQKEIRSRSGKSPSQKMSANPHLDLQKESATSSLQKGTESLAAKSSQPQKACFLAEMMQKDVKPAGVTKADIRPARIDRIDIKPAGKAKTDIKAAVTAKRDIKPFQHVDNLHKQIAKPKSPVPKFIPWKFETNRSQSQPEKASSVNINPKREKPSPLIKSTTKSSSVSDTKAKTATGSKKMGEIKRTPNVKKDRISENDKLNKEQTNRHEGEQKEMRAVLKPNVDKKTESRRSVPTSIYGTKIMPKKITDTLKARQSLPCQYSTKSCKDGLASQGTEAKMAPKKPKQSKEEVAFRNRDVQSIPKKSSESKPRDILKDALHEIKSICGSHKSKLTIREAVWPPETSEISSSENDLSYTSEIF